MYFFQRKFLIVLSFCLILLGLVFSPLFFPFQNVQADSISTSVSVEVEETPPPSGGGGGGGGSGSDTTPTPIPTATKVILQGKAYPNSSITILMDGKVITTTKADSKANFKKEISNITAGVNTFSLWAQDKQGRKSITLSFTTNVMSGMTTTISGVFLPPTIELNRTNLKKGETLDIYGQTASESEINIQIESIEQIIKKTKADINGDWDYLFNTNILDDGFHTVRAKAQTPEGLLSTFSNTLTFSIGEEILKAIKEADITNDEKVNLVDFSILLYNWGVAKSPSADFNSDGKVNLTDFSIMMYHWTG